MTTEDVHGLLRDVAFAFGFPVVAFILFWFNAQFSKSTWSRNKSGWFTEQKIRIAIVFCLLLFAFLFGGVVLYQDRPTLASLWQGSPIRFSLLYIVVAVLIAALISIIVWWKLRPSLWTIGTSESNA